MPSGIPVLLVVSSSDGVLVLVAVGVLAVAAVLAVRTYG